MPQPITLISHVWNEAFFLPHFIRHYLPLCDRAVIIDYDSVDGSREIINAMAPEWEVRQSVHQWFLTGPNTHEVGAIEREFHGWKISANVTEYFVHEDLRSYLADLEKHGRIAVWATDFIIVDRPEEVCEPVTDAPLVAQKHFGRRSVEAFRARMIHCSQDWHWGSGRHTSTLADKVCEPDLFVAWFGFAPLRYVWHRRLATQTMIPPDLDGGFHHRWNGQTLKGRYHEDLRDSVDLFEAYPAYREAVECLPMTLTQKVHFRLAKGA